MTMGDDIPVTSLVLPVLLRPILSQVNFVVSPQSMHLHSAKHFSQLNCLFVQLERRDVVASQTLRAALTKAEQSHPGLSYDIVMGILKKGDLNVNVNESILRLQGGASETDCKFILVHGLSSSKSIQSFSFSSLQ